MIQRRSRSSRLPQQPVVLKIDGLSHEGRGVAHIDGKVAFVSGALPGEQVQARYVHRRRKFDELNCERTLEASADRVVAPCQFSSVCGGCSLQHMDGDAQVLFKQGVLQEHLQHAAGKEPDCYELLPPLRGPTLYYRRKARLAVRRVAKKGGVLVGFREKFSSFITDMNNCSVLTTEVAELIQPLRELIDSLQLRNEIPQIEVAVGEISEPPETTLQPALVFRHLKALPSEDHKTLQEFARRYQLDLYLQPSGPESVHKFYPQGSAARLHYHLPDFGLKLAFHPMDFTQINAPLNRSIVGRVIEMLNLQKTDQVLDLFCGLGNFTLPAATQSQFVVGIEGAESMVERGVENATINKITNVRFHSADLFRSISDHSWSLEKYDKIILDPPRSGALEIMREIAALGARRIIYVSCNPATLARDAAVLIDEGYQLKSAGVMDMFPHTSHVESMAVFDRR